MQSSLAAIRLPALGALCPWLRVVVLLALLVTIAVGQDGGGAAGQPPEPVSPTNSPSILTRVIGTDVWRSSVGGLRNVGSGTINVGGLNGTVTKAYLFWHGVTNTLDPNANSNVQFNGFTVFGAPLGTSYDNNWGYSYSQAYRADVTGLVAFNPNRSYLLNGFGNSAFNPNGATLLIFYNDANSANDYDVTILNGNDSNGASDFDRSGWDANFGQIYDYNVLGDVLVLIVADGQTLPDPAMFVSSNITRLLRDAGPTFQGDSVPATNNGPLGNGNLWDVGEFNFDTSIYAYPGYNNIRLTMNTPIPNQEDALSLVAALACVPIGPEQVHITNPRVGGNLENTTQNALLGGDITLTANLYPDGLTGGNFSWSFTGQPQIVSGATNQPSITVHWTQLGTYAATVNYTRNGTTLTATLNVAVGLPTLQTFTANQGRDLIVPGRGCPDLVTIIDPSYILGCPPSEPLGINFSATVNAPGTYISDLSQSGIKFVQAVSTYRRRLYHGNSECATRRNAQACITEGIISQACIDSGWQLDTRDPYERRSKALRRFSENNLLTIETEDYPHEPLQILISSNRYESLYIDDRFEMYVYYFAGTEPATPVQHVPLGHLTWNWGGQVVYDSTYTPPWHILATNAPPTPRIGQATNTTVSFQGNGNVRDVDFTTCPDGPPPINNQIDWTRYFVRQQYLDILHREPDEGGWDAWTSVITRCGFDTDCIHSKRIVTAKGFLESPENFANDPNLVNPGSHEYNREYVRLCYTSFLQRSPDDGGWDGWTNYIDTHPNDYDTVVRGFIDSIEYRSRFGPA